LSHDKQPQRRIERHNAGFVDELRLIVYPLIAGEGKALFATTGVAEAHAAALISKTIGIPSHLSLPPLGYLALNLSP
jgi:hypothetical protein